MPNSNDNTNNRSTNNDLNEGHGLEHPLGSLGRHSTSIFSKPSGVLKNQNYSHTNNTKLPPGGHNMNQGGHNTSFGGRHQGHTTINNNPPKLVQQINDLNSMMTTMEKGGKKEFSFTEICPYLFANFEIPKFDKYKGESYPIQHLKEFYVVAQEASHNDNFPQRLFTRSLGGPSLKWPMNLVLETIIETIFVLSLMSNLNW